MAKRVGPGNTNRRVQSCFKFLEPQWAHEMLTKGSVRISPMGEFRKSHHQGLIHDREEGLAWFLWISKGVLDCEAYDVGNAYMYCTTTNLFSETLQWALNEVGRRACVLVTDISALHAGISDDLATEMAFFAEGPCIYQSRIQPSFGAPPPHGVQAAAWTKPPHFCQQSEFRGVWFPKLGACDPIVRCIPDMQDFLIPVDLSALDSGLRFKRLRIEIQMTSGVRRAECAFEHPIQSFSPVIHFDGADHWLGIEPLSNFVSFGVFDEPSMNLGTAVNNDAGKLLMPVRLSEVVLIKYTSLD